MRRLHDNYGSVEAKNTRQKMICALLSCFALLSSTLQRSCVNFVRVRLINNAFQNINQAIYLKYWHNECPAKRTLNSLFGAE